MTISVAPGSTILVTGASGFIGSHCVKQLLQAGYKVKAAVRSQKKFDLLKLCFENTHDNLFSFFISDIGNYEELVNAVSGCDGVLHLASPFVMSANDYVKELLEPAVNGTNAIMKACLTEPKIKRVVITSSFAAVYDASKGLQPGVVLNEGDFSPLTWKDGANAKDVGTAYRASKTLAERAAWDFVNSNDCHFDLSVLCPSMVFGPLIDTKMFSSIEELNLSNKLVWTISTAPEIPPTKAPLYVDVRDLALAHITALSSDRASNSRYIVSAGDFDHQEIADILREHFKDTEFGRKIAIGEPGKRLTGTHFTTDSSKAEKELGTVFTPLKYSVTDLMDQLISLNKA